MGVRLADAHPADGETLSLYVPASRPLFLRGAWVGREFSKPVTKADVDAFVARQAIEAMSVTVEVPTVSDHAR